MYSHGAVVTGASVVVAAGPGQEVTRSVLAATGAGVGTVFFAGVLLVVAGIVLRFTNGLRVTGAHRAPGTPKAGRRDGGGDDQMVQ